MTISNKLQEIYASAPHDVDYVETVEFNHSTFSAPYYFTNRPEKIDFLLSSGSSGTTEFTPIPFRIKLPTNEQGTNNELTITVANAGLEMMQALELAQTMPHEGIQATYRVYTDVAGTSPETDPPLMLSITDIVANSESVSMTCNRFDVLGRQFAKLYYDTVSFAGLER